MFKCKNLKLVLKHSSTLYTYGLVFRFKIKTQFMYTSVNFGIVLIVLFIPSSVCNL